MTQTTSKPAEYLLCIGGEWQSAQNRKTFGKRNPYTGEQIARVAAASAADARRAADAAEAAFPGWAALSPGARRTLFLKAAEVMEAAQDEVIRTIVAELGSPLAWAGFNHHYCVDLLREAAAQTYALVGEVIPSDIPHQSAYAVRQPAGVVLGMAPWNAPLILGLRSIAMPLAYGNTVVFKGSEESPGVHALIVRLLNEAGFPPGVVNYVSHTREDAAEVVEALVAHPAVRRVNFTGSTPVGRKIAEVCARHLKPAVLELGGKAPFIVLPDANIEAAVGAATFGAFLNQGQICMTTQRLIVHKDVKDAFEAGLKERVSRLNVGDPSDPQTQVGCLINPQATERVQGLLKDALDKGARVLVGGEMVGPCLQPTVVTGVTHEMKLYYEEAFGPLVPVIEVGSVEEAIYVANDSEYGLSSAVFTEDQNLAWEVASKLDTGMVHINDATVNDEPQMPFGGVKGSGYGHFGGKSGLHEFTELRWITVQRRPRQFPL
ncbi:benzaldehyde dehydrogenase (NAD) [Deinococcus reticulitermitis]|uniref:Salicylaldehyde dehydrogenase n=1 Tax=Deinococcus reticulitermitis TaxID=856736 RepID=A0A1H6XV76_9DEIO|nr:aldehyde dehydrogenase [Deinococcus reticulitermitis]SEJ32939.1 benzaldehyde dehydrogenase (NAD) [Deinococcus reticulitermitis]